MAVDDGSVLTIAGLTASALNDLLVEPTDVTGYNWLSLSLTDSVYVGRLLPQFSYNPEDPTSWRSIKTYDLRTLDAGDVENTGTSASATVLGTPIYFPFFRVVMSEYTSGEAVGSLQLSKSGPPALQFTTTYVRILPAKNDIGFVNNDGNGHAEIAAGVTSDTAVSLFGGMLASILVTTLGTAELVLYDNNAAASGAIVGIVPASTARGTIIRCNAPINTGIMAKGNANAPGVTIFFAS
jgi:hypothetical protein